MFTWLSKILSSVLFLASIVFTIPLAFDVGGRECGLAFSLSITIFYFVYSALRLATPEESRFRYAFVSLVAAFQWLVIPALLIWSLNQFSVDSGNTGSWVERTFDRKRAGDESIKEWIFGRHGLFTSLSIGAWDKLMHWSVPVFQLSEGFCSLLAIQAAGQITRWLVNKEGGDGWMVSALSTLQLLGLANGIKDCSPGRLSFNHLDGSLLHLSHYNVPRDRQRRCNFDRGYRHLCRFLERMGDWKRAW